jgi:hypothetical protein
MKKYICYFSCVAKDDSSYVYRLRGYGTYEFICTHIDVIHRDNYLFEKEIVVKYLSLK